MENFKQTLRRRTIFTGLYCAVILILIVASVVFKVSDLATTFTLGFGLGIEAVMVFLMVKSLGALKDDEKLKALYIAENDERQKFINAKIGGVGLNFSMLVLSLAMLVFNYFNHTIFLTLLAVVLFMVAVKLVLKLYYSKRV